MDLELYNSIIHIMIWVAIIFLQVSVIRNTRKTFERSEALRRKNFEKTWELEKKIKELEKEVKMHEVL